MSDLPYPLNQYEGSLCKRGHDWNGKGVSLRYCISGGCVQCQKERLAKGEDKEKRRNSFREYYQKNRELCLEKAKEYREKHLERIKERNRKYYQENREKIKKYTRKRYQLYREQYRQYAKEYYRKKKEEANR